MWGLGLATLKADLNATPMGNNSDSWVLCSDGNLRHNKEEMHRITQTIQEGDTIVNDLQPKPNCSMYHILFSHFRVLVIII